MRSKSTLLLLAPPLVLLTFWQWAWPLIRVHMHTGGLAAMALLAVIIRQDYLLKVHLLLGQFEWVALQSIVFGLVSSRRLAGAPRANIVPVTALFLTVHMVVVLAAFGLLLVGPYGYSKAALVAQAAAIYCGAFFVTVLLLKLLFSEFKEASWRMTAGVLMATHLVSITVLTLLVPLQDFVLGLLMR